MEENILWVVEFQSIGEDHAPFSDCSFIYISIKLTFQCSKWFEQGHTAEDNGRSRLGLKSSNF